MTMLFECMFVGKLDDLSESRQTAAATASNTAIQHSHKMADIAHRPKILRSTAPNRARKTDDATTELFRILEMGVPTLLTFNAFET